MIAVMDPVAPAQAPLPSPRAAPALHPQPPPAQRPLPPPGPAPKARPHLVNAVIDKVKNLTPEQIRSYVVAHSSSTVRRWLYGRPKRRNRVNQDSALFISVLDALLDTQAEGVAAAEVAITLLPRILMRKQMGAYQQALHFLGRSDLKPNRARKAGSLEAWVKRCEDAANDRSSSKLGQLLENGPNLTTALGVDPKPYFPAVKEVRGGEGSKLSSQPPDNTPAFDGKFFVRWIRSHQSSTGGSTGWSARLLVGLLNTDRDVTLRLAELWARPISRWDPLAAELAMRQASGWMIPKPNKPGEHRPIVAPTIIRRIRTAADVAAISSLVKEYCIPRGQLGPAGQSHKLFYGMLAQVVVATGGTSLSADRSASYQRFDRPAIIQAAEHFVATMLNTGADPRLCARFERLVKECYLDSPGLPRLVVHFDDVEVTVPALPQGCSLSPVLEAITLSWTMEKTPVPKGLASFGAHDDWQGSFYGSDLAPLVKPPDTSLCGGEYNVGKAVAVGAQAGLLRDAKVTDRHRVWGRCVGNPNTWTADWMKAYRTRIHNLRVLTNADPDVGAVAATRIGGPGNLARHWLRGMTPSHITETVLAHLKEADNLWVDLWTAIAGHTPTAETRKEVHAKTFDDLRQCSAAQSASQESLRGLALTLNLLMQEADKQGWDVGQWAAFLQLPCLADNTLTHSQKLLQAQADLVGKIKLTVQPPAREPNLWRDAIAPLTELHTAIPHRLKAGRPLRLAACMVLGLSVLPLYSLPSQCPLCGASQPNGRVGRVGVRSIMDTAGDHAWSCRSMYNPHTGKHDRLVRIVADIADLCGLKGSFNNEKLVEGQGGRPADWIEDDVPQYPAGLCGDVTIVTGGAPKAEGQVTKKTRKYAGFFQNHPTFGFNVLACATDGSVKGHYDQIVKRWTDGLRRRRSDDNEALGNAAQEVRSSLAYAFAVVMDDQLRRYSRKCALRGTEVSENDLQRGLLQALHQGRNQQPLDAIRAQQPIVNSGRNAIQAPSSLPNQAGIALGQNL